MDASTMEPTTQRERNLFVAGRTQVETSPLYEDDQANGASESAADLQEASMQFRNRAIAAIATLAMTVLLFAVPSARASEAEPPKNQDRVSEERFAAPAMVTDRSLTAEQLAAYGARNRRQDRLAVGAGDCQTATWPEIPLRCLFVADGQDRTQRNVRMITVETRVGTNTSVLTRVPADIAAR
jgi:hypothetical protein